jgi:hypothetical protein
MVTIGRMRRSAKIRRRSRARKRGEATFSWTVSASFSASRSFVGVVIRLTWATRTFLLTTSWITRQTSDVFPYRRGARTTTSWPFRMSRESSRISSSRFVNASSSASAP